MGPVKVCLNRIFQFLAGNADARRLTCIIIVTCGVVISWVSAV